MKKIAQLIRKRFITGLLIILPIAITIWVIYRIFTSLDSILGKTINNVFEINIPGLGLLATLAIIFLVGMVADNLIGRKITQLTEKLFKSLPIVKTIYTPLRDILKNFSGNKTNNFKKVVFVNFPMEGSSSLGFITNESVTINGQEKVAIFIPTTPNPTNGFLVYLSPDKYIELDMPVDEALKTIISLGAISPEMIDAQ